jgi:hypothetical protein
MRALGFPNGIAGDFRAMYDLTPHTACQRIGGVSIFNAAFGVPIRRNRVVIWTWSVKREF